MADRESTTVREVVPATVSESSSPPDTASTVATPPRGLACCQSASVIHTTGLWLYQSSPRTAATVNVPPSIVTSSPADTPSDRAAPSPRITLPGVPGARSPTPPSAPTNATVFDDPPGTDA